MNISTCVIWLLMRLSCIECTFSEVRQRQYESDQEITILPDNIEISEKKIAFLKEKSAEVQSRRDKADEKARNLLTLTSLLFGLTSSANGIASEGFLGLWSIIPLTFLFLSLFLLVEYFGINRSQSASYDYLLEDSDSADRTLCNALLSSQQYNNRVTDFLLDLYRSAMRYFLLAALLIMFLGTGSILSKDSSVSLVQIEVQDSIRDKLNRVEKLIEHKVVDVQKLLKSPSKRLSEQQPSAAQD